MSVSRRAIAFVIPNAASSADLLSFALTVDEVEARTGLDLFAELPEEEQAGFEGTVCGACWADAD